MKRNPLYLLSLAPPLVVITGNLLGGWWVSLNIFFSLVLLALAELFTGENRQNDSDHNDWLPDVILFFHVTLQCLCLTTFFYRVSMHDLKIIQTVLMSVATGINTGASAIVIAHELIHRKSRVFQRAGQFLLLTAGNIYFYVDHLKVHHKWVGTKRDPATARMGENVYAFFIRSAWGQTKSSWKTENERLKKSGRKIFSIHHYVLVASLLLLIACIMIYYFFSWTGLAAFLLQSLVANFLLEYTNYIEHYGLERSEHERVNELHSWQSDKVVSRFFLVDLSRHSDHHYYSSKPYHTLNSYPRSPVLPGGYVSMIYAALIPALWFRIMDPLIRSLKSR